MNISLLNLLDLLFGELHLSSYNQKMSKWKWHPKAYLITMVCTIPIHLYVLMMSKSSTMDYWCCRFFSPFSLNKWWPYINNLRPSIHLFQTLDKLVYRIVVSDDCCILFIAFRLWCDQKSSQTFRKSQFNIILLCLLYFLVVKLAWIYTQHTCICIKEKGMKFSMKAYNICCIWHFKKKHQQWNHISFH